MRRIPRSTSERRNFRDRLLVARGKGPLLRDEGARSTSDRTRDAERFAAALESPTSADADDLAADLAVADQLRAAARPAKLDDDARERIRAHVAQELGLRLPRVIVKPAPKPRVAPDLAVPANVAPETPAPPSSPTPAHRPAPARHPAERPAAAKASAGTGPANRPAETRRKRRAERERSTVRSRFGVAAAAVLCLAVALGGMSLIASKGALPGDSFYALKRGVENASVDMSADGQRRADRLEQLADQRISDLAAMAARSPQPVAADFRLAINDLTGATLQATQLITRSGTNDSGKALTDLATWSTGAAGKLSAVDGKLPASVAGQAKSGVAMLHAVTKRADALYARLGCDEITSGSADAIGLLPATARCHPAGTGHPTAPPPRVRPDPRMELHAPSTSAGDAASPDSQPSVTQESATPALPNAQVTQAPQHRVTLPTTAPARTPATPNPSVPARPGGLLGGLGGLLGG